MLSRFITAQGKFPVDGGEVDNNEEDVANMEGCTQSREFGRGSLAGKEQSQRRLASYRDKIIFLPKLARQDLLHRNCKLHTACLP